MSSTHQERLPALDGLRGIAILMVMYYHTSLIIGAHSTINNHLFTITDSWHIGVDLFFVLSGYLITNILIKQRASSTYYRAFYWRRVLRIFPLYYLTVILLGFLAPQDVSAAQAPWYIFFASNIYIVLHGFNHTMVAPLWSVAMEEQFYAVWPIVTKYVKVTRIPFVILILLFSQPLLRYLLPENYYTNPILRLDGLLVGSLIAFTWQRIAVFFRTSRYASPLLVSSVAYLICRTLVRDMRHHIHHSFFAYYDFQLVAICFGIILACAIAGKSNTLANVLNNSMLKSFGVYSYSLYLFHSIIGFQLASNGLVPHVSSGIWNIVAALAWSSVVIAITWMIGYLSWRFLESPILGYKDRVPYRSHNEPVPALVLTEA